MLLTSILSGGASLMGLFALGCPGAFGAEQDMATEKTEVAQHATLASRVTL